MQSILPVILFWLTIQLFALATLPLTWRLLRWLPDRGYALAKPLGLLLVTFVLWLGASFGFLRNSAGGVLLALLVVASLSLWVSWRERGGPSLRSWLRQNLHIVVATELLFLGALLAWAYFRAFDPAISGTEKPMELAFLNGVLRSERFPPMDPWLSGFAISYYYFGYVMLAVLTQITGVPAAYAFNTGLATWFALVATAAFSVAYNLVKTHPLATQRQGLLIGLLASVFVVILGNQVGAVEVVYHNRILPAETIAALDIKELTDTPPSGLWHIGDNWWWWHASRVIHDRDPAGQTVEVIDEFPNFSFILGDMHPHVLALPFVIVAIGLALNLLLATLAGEPDNRPLRRWLFDRFPLGILGFGLYAVVLGALSFLNTWDFPIYLVLTVLAYGAALAINAGGVNRQVIARSLLVGGGLGLLGILFYVPFYVGFQSQAGGILPNVLFPTRVTQYFLMFAPFLVALLALLSVASAETGGRRVLRSALGWLPWTIGLPVLVLLVLLLVIGLTAEGQGVIAGYLNNPAISAALGSPTMGGLLAYVGRLRLSNPWTFLLLAGLIAWVIGLVLTSLHRPAATAENDPVPATRAVETRLGGLVFALLLGLVALLLTFGPEFVYLRDNFGTRMNTVFKFYYQGWVLLALVAAYAVAYLLRSRVLPAVRVPALVLIAVLTLTGLYYPVAASYSKAGRFAREPTLDGLAYLRQYNAGDYGAIAWLEQNAADARVVLESSGGSYDRDGAGRVSMATGIPTLLGWDGHESQWRGRRYGEMVAGRPEALEAIYRGARAAELNDLLVRWGIDYVVVGRIERDRYRMTPQASARFAQVMDLVYDQDEVQIYRRRGPVDAAPVPVSAFEAPAGGVLD